MRTFTLATDTFDTRVRETAILFGYVFVDSITFLKKMGFGRNWHALTSEAGSHQAIWNGTKSQRPICMVPNLSLLLTNQESAS